MAVDPRILASLYPTSVPMAAASRAQPAGVFVTPNQPNVGGAVVTPRPIPQANPYQAALARQLMATGASTAPVASPIEGIARALTGAVGGYFAGQANEAEQAREAATAERLGALMGLSPEQTQGLSPEQILGVGAVQGKQQAETWRPLTGAEAAQYGVPEGEVWQISSRGKLREPGGASTTINLPGEARESFTDTLGKVDAKRYEGWAQAADTAASQLGSINRARRLLDEGLRTGRITAIAAPFGEFMAAFGVDPGEYGLEDVADVQEFTSIANRMTTDLTSKLKGALSDRELRFLERANISVANTPESNRAIMDMLEKGANQQIMRLGAADEWIANYGDLRTKNDNNLTFMQAWSRYLEDNETIPETVSQDEPEADEPETQEAGMARITVTPETDITGMSDGELLGVDVNSLSAEQFKTWNDEMSKRGY